MADLQLFLSCLVIQPGPGTARGISTGELYEAVAGTLVSRLWGAGGGGELNDTELWSTRPGQTPPSQRRLHL